jgi:hypothetical protein
MDAEIDQKQKLILMAREIARRSAATRAPRWYPLA